MRSLFGLLVIAFVFIMGGLYAYRRMQQVPLVAPAVPPKSSEKTSYAEAKQAAQAVKMVGPLAEYMANQEGPTPAAKDVETVTWIPLPATMWVDQLSALRLRFCVRVSRCAPLCRSPSRFPRMLPPRGCVAPFNPQPYRGVSRLPLRFWF